MDEYKLLENLYLEKEKENLKLREQINYIKDRSYEKDYKKNLPTPLKREPPKKVENNLDTISTMKNAKNIKMDEKKEVIKINPEETPYVKKLNKKRLSNINKISPIAYNNINISNISNSRNYLSLINNDITNFSNSTFNMESYNNTQFPNNNNNLNNLLLIDLEMEQYNKVNNRVY